MHEILKYYFRWVCPVFCPKTVKNPILSFPARKRVKLQVEIPFSFVQRVCRTNLMCFIYSILRKDISKGEMAELEEDKGMNGRGQALE